MRDNAGILAGCPTTGSPLGERFGIDHRRREPRISSQYVREAGRAQLWLLFCLGQRPRPDGRARREADTQGRRFGARLIRGLADADIHIACRPTTYLLASLYTTAKTLLVRGSPQMNKVYFVALSWWCPCPVYGRCFLPCCAWTFTAPTILHWTVSPMIDVEITPEAQCRDGGRPASLALHLYVFPSDLSSFYLLVPLSGDHPFCLESAFGFLHPLENLPTSRAIRSRASSGIDEFLIKRFIYKPGEYFLGNFKFFQVSSNFVRSLLFSNETGRSRFEFIGSERW